jgi:hypothetical protein
MPPPGDFAELKTKYLSEVPLARHASTPGQLVDRIVRQRIFEQPRLSYGQALREVLAADPDLKRLYAES